MDLLHSVGLKVFGYTANDATEWRLLESLGVDGIYTNDIPLGVELQASVSSLERPRGPLATPRDHGHHRLSAGHRR